MKRTYRMVSIDFQREFTHPSGKCYRPRASVGFVRDVLVPFMRENGIKLAEIISDYRQPRPGDLRDICRPGEEGYISDIPEDVKHPDIWIKAMNSPLWTRENAGLADREPGLPYQDPEGLARWIGRTIGSPDEARIVLVGLTLDSCVLSAAQEFRWRGFEVSILAQATDTASGSREEKEYLLANPPVTNWADVVSWEELKGLLGDR